MANWQQGKVAANGINLAYTRTGGDKAPLLLAHGLTDSGLCWRRVANVMQQYFDVVMLDARGHGDSDKPESGYSASEHAADLAGVIEALQLNNAVVMGHSMGATSTAILAAERPDLISCAVLEDPVWRFENPDDTNPATQAAASAEWATRLEEQQKLTPYEILMRGRIQNPTWGAEDFPDWVEAKPKVSPAVFQFITESRPSWTDYVPTYVKPVLLLYGEPALGGIVSPAVAAEAHRLNPKVVPHQVSGAGHNIRRMQFNEYISELKEFVAAVRQDRVPA